MLFKRLIRCQNRYLYYSRRSSRRRGYGSSRIHQSPPESYLHTLVIFLDLKSDICFQWKLNCWILNILLCESDLRIVLDVFCYIKSRASVKWRASNPVSTPNHLTHSFHLSRSLPKQSVGNTSFNQQLKKLLLAIMQLVTSITLAMVFAYAIAAPS